MSAKRRFVLVDVFADRPLAGNPLAVFPEADGLPPESLQALAREMDHAATAFLFPSKLPGAAFRLRIFSRDREIPFVSDLVPKVDVGAGRVTVASLPGLLTD